MKRTCIAVLCVTFTALHAQIFTKITDLAPTQDGGDSRSVNWVDVDDDGDLDLSISNGHSPATDNFFYINNGDGTFSRADTVLIANDGGRSDGSSWGDFDNDGDPDLYTANWYNDPNMFYENHGSNFFTRILTGAIATDGGYSESCSWADYDNDGYLDLYVANSGPGFGTANFLYRNLGDGSFEKITQGAPVSTARFSRSVNWADYDNDGDVDLFVTNEENQDNQLIINLLVENGVAEFVALSADVLVTDGGNSCSGSWADYDNDGDLDMFVANLGQNNALYRNDGAGGFSKVSDDPAVSDGGNSFGSSWGDYDNDGDLDLFVANGWGTGAQDNFLYKNVLMETGTAGFERVVDEPVSSDDGWSYGSSWGDYDDDGDLDLMVAQWLNSSDEDNNLFRNDLSGENGWLAVSTKGFLSNRSGIGARISVHTNIAGNPLAMLRQVAGQDSYCGQNLRQHFGLGDAAAIDSVVVYWPSGIRQVIVEPAINQHLQITEPSETGLEGSRIDFPDRFQLDQNYPNPFNPETVIGYSLFVNGYVQLEIFDIAGRKIKTAITGQRATGRHTYSWDGTDDSGRPVPSGVYFYRLAARNLSFNTTSPQFSPIEGEGGTGGMSQTRKMILLR